MSSPANRNPTNTPVGYYKQESNECPDGILTASENLTTSLVSIVVVLLLGGAATLYGRSAALT